MFPLFDGAAVEAEPLGEANARKFGRGADLANIDRIVNAKTHTLAGAIGFNLVQRPLETLEIVLLHFRPRLLFSAFATCFTLRFWSSVKLARWPLLITVRRNTGSALSM